MAGNTTYGILVLAMLLFCSTMDGQFQQLSLGPWTIRSVSGELSGRGLYSRKYSAFSDFNEQQNSTYFIGGITLNTSSYLWRPEIISFKLNAEFNPETRNEDYLTIPDRSEVRTLNKIDFSTSLLSQKNVSLDFWINFNQSYFNRENLTNIRSDNKQWGTTVRIKNRILPFSIQYMVRDWNQLETESNRSFSMNQRNIQAKVSRSFFASDKHNFLYSYNDYKYTYANLSPINNLINRITLNDSFSFGKEENNTYRSVLSFHSQKGNNVFNKLDISENVVFKLPYNLQIRGSYNYYRMNESRGILNTNKTLVQIKHSLYESLESEVFFGGSAISHTIFNENEFKTGGSVNYTKKLPFGQINLKYRYYRQHNTISSESGMIHIMNEPIIPGELSGIFLTNPYVDLSTIVITDINGAIIYEEGLDYLLQEINNYVEIVRVPGGQIAESQEVLVSYMAVQPGSSHYELNNHSYNASLFLFNRLVECYFRGGIQNMHNVEYGEYLTLNEYNQKIFGGRITYKFFSLGAEYDLYHSSLIPYERVNYFINLNFKIRNSLAISANGNLRDYKLLATDINQKYANLSLRMSYEFNRNSSLNFQVGYLSQRGKDIDLDLLTSRMDFVYTIRKLHIKAGMNFYNRSYSKSTFTYARTFIEISRTF